MQDGPIHAEAVRKTMTHNMMLARESISKDYYETKLIIPYENGQTTNSADLFHMNDPTQKITKRDIFIFIDLLVCNAMVYMAIWITSTLKMVNSHVAMGLFQSIGTGKSAALSAFCYTEFEKIYK
jgi:hypothetical protein